MTRKIQKSKDKKINEVNKILTKDKITKEDKLRLDNLLKEINTSLH